MSALTVLEELYRADPQTDRVSLTGLGLEHLDDAALAFIRDNLPSLRHLDLRDNAIAQLPADLGSCVPKLVALDVRNNPFTSIPELSEALASCASLQSLYVTLHNKTDENVLRVMVPKLRLLNGVSISDGDHGRTMRSSPLSLDLALSPTSCSSSDDSFSPKLRWLDTPPSTAASAVRPVRSPQEKRELRIHLAAASNQRTKTPTTSKAKLSPRRVQSVKPTELPATISDENTDWRKLLKQTTATREQKHALTSLPDQAREVEPTIQNASDTTTTRTFIAELKGIVRGFQKPLAGHASQADDHKLLEQLERKIDQLALQLNDMEKKPNKGSADPHEQDGHVLTASLAARWRLAEASTLYATHKASSLDRQLGAGLHRLLQTQTQVVEALLRHVNDAIYAQHKWQTASESQQQVAEQQKQQMKLLLDVAETLEKDLETLQAKYEHEKTQREQAQAANQSLQTEYNELKQSCEQQQQLQSQPSRHPNGQDESSQTTAQLQRRIRRRQEGLNVAKPHSFSPKAQFDVPPHTSALAPRPSSPSKPPTNPPIVRTLTLKQLVDLIHCILTSKSKYDGRTAVIGAPPETVEQHMYTYLNQRFGLQQLIIEYASAIWKACQMYTRQDNDVAMFHALLRNQVDEDFIGIKKKLQHAVRELLRAYFHAKHPLKAESVLQKMVDTRLHGGMIYEEEWTELLLYLYDPSDSSILMRLTKRKAEVHANQQQGDSWDRPAKRTSTGLPFAVFEKLLYDYQLQGRLKLLDNFRSLFSEYDGERVGILTRKAFRNLVAQLAPRKSDGEVAKMWERVDPFEHDSVTFSDAVRCLLPDIRQHSVNRRRANTANEKSTTQRRR